MSSGSNWRHLNRPQTEEARRSIRPAFHGVPAKLQHFPTEADFLQKCSKEILQAVANRQKLFPFLALILNEFNFAEEGNGFKEGIVIIIFATFINSVAFLYRHVL